MYKIAVCDTFHCNDGAQCAGKISSIKRTKTRQLTEQGLLKENRKLLEQGGYQRFWKIQKRCQILWQQRESIEEDKVTNLYVSEYP